MPSSTLIPGARATAVLLILAPLGEVVEGVLSPLDGSSTTKDLAAIAAHQGMFQLSVVIGTISTFLFVPAFLGLAQACLARSPRLARVAGWTAFASMGGFLAVRMGQAIELAGVRQGIDHRSFAGAVDRAATNWIGGSLLVVFLGGALVGVILLALVAWRAGLPKVACVLLAVFQIVDFVVPSHPVPVSHLMLLVALGWFAKVLWSSENKAELATADQMTTSSV